MEFIPIGLTAPSNSQETQYEDIFFGFAALTLPTITSAHDSKWPTFSHQARGLSGPALYIDQAFPYCTLKINVMMEIELC
jgi:hypothetical protein